MNNLETIISVWKRGEEVVTTPEHGLNHFKLGGEGEYIRKDKKDENSVNDMNLSDVTDITGNNNEDSREKLQIIMPSKMLKRGRPKGAETTVIGSSKKKQSCSKKPLPFSRLGPKEKDRIILECLINERIVVNNALDGKKLVMPEELRCIASISDTIRDSSNIAVYRIERYFSKVAWENALILLAKKEKNAVVLFSMF